VFNKNLLVLIFCQVLGTSASVLMVTIGGIIGSSLAPSKALATLPVSIVIIGTALATYPASMIMQTIGRRSGFSLGALVGGVALLICGGSLLLANFYLYCFGCLLFGFNLAFIMQYRFGAAESVAKKNVSKAVSWVLVGSIGGAFIGPALATHAAHLNNTPYVGSLFVAALLMLLSAGVLSTLRIDSNTTLIESADLNENAIRGLMVKRIFILAVFAGVTAQGVMSLIMTATPISMHLHQGHNMDSTAMVIQSHVLAMYLPSLFSGYLISFFGIRKLMIGGCILFLATLAAGFSGQAVMHYWWSLVLLGVAWNFLFIAGTTLLTTTYASKDKFVAQGLNDLFVFGGAALASLLAGTMLHYFGWHSVLLSVIPLLAFMMVFIFTTKILPAQTSD